MTAYVIRRLWQMIPTIFGVILLIFFLFNWVGGDPAQVLAGKISNPDQIANIRKQLGVDLPYWQQLLIFIKQVFTFDFGRSWSTNEEVSRILLTRVGPTLTIMLAVFVSLAPSLRLYRSFFLDEINQDYVRTARAKGVPERKVMLKHVLRNALIPILTNVGISLPGVFVGSFLLEVFFSIPGLGREIITAVNRSDFPVIKAVTVYLAMFTMIINLVVDVLYKVVDPRVSFK